MKNFALVFLIALSTLASCKQFQKEILISKAQIQNAVNDKLPYEKNAIVARLSLNDATVYFKDENIGIKLGYQGDYLSKSVKGVVDFNGKIHYGKENAAFYLHDFEIVSVSANEANLLQQKKLETIILTIAKNYLSGYPVYQLDQEDFKQNLAKLVLQKVSVKNENLAITLGL